MKYDKNMFVYNLKYLISYGWEPEITIELKNNHVFLVAYQDHIELSIDSKEISINNVEELFDYIHFDDIIHIEGDIDFQFPIETQSIVVDGKLWIDGHSPTQVIRKFKKKFSIVRGLLLTYFIGVFIYFLITILNSETFDSAVIIACSIFLGSVLLIMIFCIIYDMKRNALIHKYYGIVSEDDKKLAKELLEQINIVNNNQYDSYIYNTFHFDIADLEIENLLKKIMKGKKVQIGLYNQMKAIEQELLNNTNNQYNDIAFNEYIYKLIALLEKNLCDI